MKARSAWRVCIVFAFIAAARLGAIAASAFVADAAGRGAATVVSAFAATAARRSTAVIRYSTACIAAYARKAAHAVAAINHAVSYAGAVATAFGA